MAANMGRFAVFQNIRYLQPTFPNKTLHLVRYYCEVATAARTPDDIIIPKRKKRDKLSILNALSSTVENYYTNPGYKYVDDPFMHAVSLREKKQYSLSLEQGRQAAQYVIKNYPEYFVNRPIEDFSAMPEAFRVTLPKHDESTVEGLEERINLIKPVDAYKCYQNLKDQGADIPRHIHKKLLQLLCFCNSEEYDMFYPVEEIHIHNEINGHLGLVEPKKTWNSSHGAEMVFKDIQHPDEDDYIALLQGRAKYYDSSGTLNLYKEMKTKEMKITREAYNAAISVAFCLKPIDKSIKFIMGVLTDMHSSQVDPELDTFNNIFRILHFKDVHRSLPAKQFCKKLLNEMLQFGIEPSLATWYYILVCLYPRTSSAKNPVTEILSYLEGKELTMQHPDDKYFFSQVMKTAAVKLEDLTLSHRVHDLLMTGNNVNFIGDSYAVNIYHSSYLVILFEKESSKKALQLYKEITEYVYNPHIADLSKILELIDISEQYHFIPQYLKDLKRWKLFDRTDLLILVMEMFDRKKHEPEVHEAFLEIVDSVMELYDRSQDDKIKSPYYQYKFTGPLFGECISLCCATDQYEKAIQFFEIYLKHRYQWKGVMSRKNLIQLIELGITKKDFNSILKVCQFMIDIGYAKLNKYVQRIKTELELTEDQLRQLRKMQQQ